MPNLPEGYRSLEPHPWIRVPQEGLELLSSGCDATLAEDLGCLRADFFVLIRQEAKQRAGRLDLLFPNLPEPPDRVESRKLVRLALRDFRQRWRRGWTFCSERKLS